MLMLLVLFCSFPSVPTQRLDYEQFASTLGTTEIPIRHPPVFSFNKDRTPSPSVKRIIGGDIATPHNYPFQVALYVYVYITRYFCGGSLISPDWVLTAAHCVEFATNIVVVLGVHNLTAQEDSRLALNTSTYVIHQNWTSRTFQNDVAVIKLPETLELNSYINVIPIAYGDDSFTGDIGRCLGWGITSFGAYSDVLRYVDDTIISNDACSAYVEYTQYIVPHHLCTSGDGFVGSCNGDSGGALVVNGIQVGIVSFGVTNCSAGWPSIYTRISEFSDWINETIESSADTINVGLFLFVISCITSLNAIL